MALVQATTACSRPQPTAYRASPSPYLNAHFLLCALVCGDTPLRSYPGPSCGLGKLCRWLSVCCKKRLRSFFFFSFSSFLSVHCDSIIFRALLRFALSFDAPLRSIYCIQLDHDDNWQKDGPGAPFRRAVLYLYIYIYIYIYIHTNSQSCLNHRFRLLLKPSNILVRFL